MLRPIEQMADDEWTDTLGALLDPAQFRPPAATCPLLSRISRGRHAICVDPVECGSCALFQGAYPRASWVCSTCHPTHPRLPFYTSGHCAQCGRESTYLQPEEDHA